MHAILLIGLQASGKSTFFRERFSDTHVRINLDMLRTGCDTPAQLAPEERRDVAMGGAQSDVVGRSATHGEELNIVVAPGGAKASFAMGAQRENARRLCPVRGRAALGPRSMGFVRLRRTPPMATFRRPVRGGGSSSMFVRELG
jgi:hypothetical protein